MTPARAERLLSGQSALAAKVFAAVPILEAWTMEQIKRELERTGTTMKIAPHTVMGCLRDLKDAGLIGEPIREHFRSNTKIPRTVMDLELNDDETETPAPASEQSMPVQAPAAAPKPATKPTTLETLANLSESLVEATTALRKVIVSVQTIAKQIDDVALTVETERQESADIVSRYHQLQALLRGE